MKQKVEDDRKMRVELQHQLVVSRKRAMRATREKHMQIIGMLPASSIQKYLEEVRQQSAVRIQASWRGYGTRRLLADRKDLAVRGRAAVVIQRAVRVSYLHHTSISC